MANKTVPTNVSVEEYLGAIANQVRKQDAITLCELVREITGEQPVMWGSTMVGFGSYHYKYESGREGDALRLGFSARSSALVLYGLIPPVEGNELLEKLGVHTRGEGCIYIKKLSDISLPILQKMVESSWATPRPYEVSF